MAQSWWLETAEIYSLTVREARALKPSWRKGCTTPVLCKEGPFPPLPASGGSWHCLACGRVTAISASDLTWLLPSVSVPSSHPQDNSGTTRNPGWSHLKILNLITPAKTPLSEGHILKFWADTNLGATLHPPTRVQFKLPVASGTGGWVWLRPGRRSIRGGRALGWETPDGRQGKGRPGRSLDVSASFLSVADSLCLEAEL